MRFQSLSPSNASPTCDPGPKRKRVLLLCGGWRGHAPKRIAAFAEKHLLTSFEVVRTDDLGLLRRSHLHDFDLLVPIWTFGALSKRQETDLLEAVADGLGLVSWHGSTSAFLSSRPHKFLLGGQFVAHPGGSCTTYAVRFLGNDPLVDGLEDLIVTSEQYYLLIDPAVKVLAETSIDGHTMGWLKGVRMPVAWIRPWGAGRVFYCALGHTVDILAHPSVATLLVRACHWACRPLATK